ncbi:MAG: hypothetical protein ABF868_11230 [Sporolactobacillus sp.]
MLQTCLSYSEKGSAPANEDAVGGCDGTYWIIDGATSVFEPTHYFGTDSDVVWLVQHLSAALTACVASKQSLAESLAQALSLVRADAAGLFKKTATVEPFRLPSFTIVMVREHGHVLDYYLLGDCGLFVSGGKRPMFLTDERLKQMTDASHRAAATIAADSLGDKRERLYDVLRGHRRLMNTPEGYWIGSLDGTGVPYGLTGTAPLGTASRVLICCDGFLRLFDLFQQHDWRARLFDRAPLVAAVSRLRTLESEDRDCRRFPRNKVSDDVTVQLLTVR